MCIPKLFKICAQGMRAHIHRENISVFGYHFSGRNAKNMADISDAAERKRAHMTRVCQCTMCVCAVVYPVPAYIFMLAQLANVVIIEARG